MILREVSISQRIPPIVALGQVMLQALQVLERNRNFGGILGGSRLENTRIYIS